MSGIQEYFIEKGKCCACDAPLKDSGHVNMVMIEKKVPWQYPIWGNVISGELGYGVGLVCDNCVNDETGQITKPVKYAVELQGGIPVEGSRLEDNLLTARFIIYHEVEDLEDGQPNIKGPTERMVDDMIKDAQTKDLFKAAKAVMPDDIIGLAQGGAETINEKNLRQSEYYVMLVNRSYINGLKDPRDIQHHDLIRQIEVAQEMEKPTVIIYDETVTDEDKEYLKQMLGNLVIRGEGYHNFTEGSPEELGEAMKKLMEALVEPDYKLQIDESVYCGLTFKWYDQPKTTCPHEWKQTRDEDHWGEWTCQKCGGRGRADIWD